MKKIIKKAALLSVCVFVIIWSLIVTVFHWGTLPPPKINMSQLHGSAKLIPKNETQKIQHLILTGDAYTRGLKAGQLTKNQLYQQEKELIGMMEKIFRAKFFVYVFEMILIPIFKGIENKIPQNFLLEMYGVSQSTNPKYDSYIDAYTRQLSYHGLHEVGQLMVDQYQDDRMENMGCTAILAPLHKSWLVGRNFDFEGGSTLDEDKIMKWVFPDHGLASVSVIWAGMVGAVTAVNEKGIYLSMNAANSDDFNRHGLPSTLLVTKVMESATSDTEAIEIIKSTPMMITEIFVLVDSLRGTAYRIEKSPVNTAVIPLSQASAITNHLHDNFWANDKTNQFRKTSLTSHYREARAQKLLENIKTTDSVKLELDFLKILRDKNDIAGDPLHIGNRRSINPLIANHSVIFNGATQTLYVSRGPHLINEFEGYNLALSFQQKTPTLTKSLPADNEISITTYKAYKHFTELISLARHESVKSQPEELKKTLKLIDDLIKMHPRFANPEYYKLQAQLAVHNADFALAKTFYEKALSAKPAYKKDEQELMEKIQ